MAKKILIIDDTLSDCKIIQRYLNKEGYDNVITAENGEDGVALAASENPDLVIIDTNMPGIDGFETCRQIRGAGSKGAPKIRATAPIIRTVSVFMFYAPCGPRTPW